MNYGKNATKRREHQVDAKSTKIRKKIGVTFGKIVLVCFLVMGFTGLFVGLGVWKGIVDSAPDISKYDVTPTGYQSVVLAADDPLSVVNNLSNFILSIVISVFFPLSLFSSCIALPTFTFSLLSSKLSLLP